MKEFFWVLPNEDETWFQIRTHDNWVCMSAVDSWERVEYCLDNFVRRYKSETHLREVISNMEYGTKLPVSEKERIRELYPIYKDYRQDRIREVISAAMTDVLVEQRQNKPFNKVMSRLKKSNTVVVGIDLSSQEDMTAQNTVNLRTGEITEQVILPRAKRPKLPKRRSPLT